MTWPRLVAMLFLVVLVLAVTLTLVACSGDERYDDGSRVHPPTTSAPAARPTASFDDTLSEQICNVAGQDRRKMADDLGISSVADTDLAVAYAEGFQPAFRERAKAACLRGLARAPK